MMGRDRWSEADHVRRTEALVRSAFSHEDETILNRKAVGAVLGQNVLTTQDIADITALKAVTEAARDAGTEGRIDAARLHAALDYEAARVRLSQPAPDPATPQDAAAWLLAQQTINATSADTLALVAERDAFHQSTV